MTFPSERREDVDVLDLLHEVEREEVLGADLELGQLLELLRGVAQGHADELLAAPVLYLTALATEMRGLAAHEADEGLLIVDLGLEVGRLALAKSASRGQSLLLELE